MYEQINQIVLYKFTFFEQLQNPLETKGRTSILFYREYRASRVASFSVSRRKLHDRECLRHDLPSRRLHPLAPLRRLSPVDGKFEKLNTEKLTVDWRLSITVNVHKKEWHRIQTVPLLKLSYGHPPDFGSLSFYRISLRQRLISSFSAIPFENAVAAPHAVASRKA